MSTQTIEQFWNHRILEWDRSRYQFSNALDTNRWIKARHEQALKTLAPFMVGKSIVDLGCGLARLAEPLVSLGVRKYLGVDFAHSAINAAAARIETRGKPCAIELIASDVVSIDTRRFDVVISLGLLDWLSNEEIKKVLQFGDLQQHFHSFSELVPGSFAQLIHRNAYRLRKTWEPSFYAPRYFREREIRELFPDATQKRVVVLRNVSSGFSRFVANFPPI